MIDSSSRRASDDSGPREVFAAQDWNSLLFETRCGVRTLHPLLNVICAAVLAIAQVYLSCVLKIRSISDGCFTCLPVGKRWQERSADHSSAESRRALRRSVNDSIRPTNWALARIISAFIVKPPRVPSRLTLTDRGPGPRHPFMTGPGLIPASSYRRFVNAILWWRSGRGLRPSGLTVVSSTAVVPCTSFAKVAPAGTR